MYTYTIEELTDLYEQHLSDLYDDVDVCGEEYESGALLRSIDYAAFESGLMTYLDATGFKRTIIGDEIVYTLE
jgi:hypothetical protein